MTFRNEMACDGSMRQRRRRGGGRRGRGAGWRIAEDAAASGETTALMVERERLLLRLQELDAELRTRGVVPGAEG